MTDSPTNWIPYGDASFLVGFRWVPQTLEPLNWMILHEIDASPLGWGLRTVLRVPPPNILSNVQFVVVLSSIKLKRVKNSIAGLNQE